MTEPVPGAVADEIVEAAPDPDEAQRAIEYCYEQGWSDGLPLVPASKPLVDAFLATTSREPDEMGALTHHIEALIAQLPPGADQARAMTAIAQSAYLRDDPDGALLWADRALALADEFDLPGVRLTALLEKGSTLAERR